MNGYSNLHFGWGGEDDNMANRVLASKLNITRYHHSIARYRMIRHGRDSSNPWNPVSAKTYNIIHPRDGLSDLKYRVVAVEEFPTHTHIFVCPHFNDDVFKTYLPDSLLSFSTFSLYVFVILTVLFLFLVASIVRFNSLKRTEDLA